MRLAVIAALLAACGGAQRGGRPAGDRVEVTIYRDAGFVTVKRRAALVAGDNPFELAGIANTVVDGSPRLRVVGGEPARVVAASHLYAEGGGDEVLKSWIGQPVEVKTAAGATAGPLLAVFPDHLVLGDGGGAVHLVARPAEVRGPRGEAAAPRLHWTLEAARPGARELEAAYAARRLAWQAAYALVLEAGDRKRAWLHGWLSISNQTGADLRADKAILADRPFARPKPRAAAPGAPPVAAPEPPPGRRIPLAAPLEVPAGAQLELPLLAGGARAVAARTTAVFDPIGDRLDQARRRPVTSRWFGATLGGEERALDTYVEVDLAAAGLSAAELPPGDVVVLERAKGGELLPLGRARAFHQASQSKTLRLAIGTVPDLVGRRRVTEFSRDDAGHRVVEELRIEIENRRAGAAEVLVREHLYRGLNWAIAYYNQAGALSKEGPQEIHVRLHVPGKSRRTIVYRVVYTW